MINREVEEEKKVEVVCKKVEKDVLLKVEEEEIGG